MKHELVYDLKFRFDYSNNTWDFSVVAFLEDFKTIGIKGIQHDILLSLWQWVNSF